MRNSRVLAGARFHLKDGRELQFLPVPSSMLRRRTGELLFAAAALALLAALFLVSALKPDNRRVRNIQPPHREESALR